MDKIDLHLHVSRVSVPKTDKMFVSSGEEMLPHLKELGIKKAVLMSIGENVSFGSNSDNKELCALYPDTYAWMCNLDPVDEDTIFERLSKYKQEGAIGVGELSINQRIDSPFLSKIFSSAEKLGLPVTFHMSPEVSYSYGVVDDPGLPLLEEALNDYPSLKLLGHSQSFWIEMSSDAPAEKEKRNAWGQGKIVPGGRVPYLFEKYPNLYGDLSANSAGCAIMRDEEFGLAFLEKFQDKLFFATDMVNVEMEFPLGKWLDDKYASGELSKEAYEKICFKNAQRVFGL